MSNHLAIATVTATLFNILEAGKEGAGTSITTKPPDKARPADSNGDQLNVFLYHTQINETWRNLDLPRQVKPGESGHPPLPLRLYYLITAFGSGDDEVAAHRVLGRAMSNLHDHPVLGREEFEGANAQLAASDLHEQVERVRITPEPLSLDDMYKLWSSFQTEYRPSAAYQVSVVLIESERPARTPLPVLTRGEDDAGVGAQANLLPPFPTLLRVLPPNGQPAAQLGDVVTLEGHHLEADSVDLVLRHPRSENPITLPAASASDTGLEVLLPTPLPPQVPPADWRAGVYSISALIHRAGEDDRESNRLPLALSPRVDAINPDPADRVTDGQITVTCDPAIDPAQHPSLLLADRQIEPAAFAAPSTDLDFPIAQAPLGEHFVRLRVDGVDSLLVDYGQTPPVFQASQKVTIKED